MFRPLEAIIRSRWVWVANGMPLATQTHLPLQDTRILTWWWPPEAETCRLIIKIPYISCNKLFSNSRLVFNLNYYKFVVLDVHKPLFRNTFNIYMNYITVHCKQIYTKCITLSTIAINNTPLFADDRIISVDSEDNVQGGVLTLLNINILEWKYHQRNLRRCHF